jgi:hypothetical protein
MIINKGHEGGSAMASGAKRRGKKKNAVGAHFTVGMQQVEF